MHQFITNNSFCTLMLRRAVINIGIIYIFLSLSACKKLIHVDEPVNTITSSEAFANAATAESAVIGIYNDLNPGNSNFNLCNMTTLYTGLSSDEFNYFLGSDATTMQFYTNSLNQMNSTIQSFWIPVYATIYRTNAVIEGVQASTTLPQATKDRLSGEAKFLRAFNYFYLTNLFGDVPLVTTTSWTETLALSRTSQVKVYGQIVADLQSAENLLPGDYSSSSGERIRANKWAAAALLARVYLYMGNWTGADSASSALITNTATYSLVSNLNNVFLKNSNEAILQLQTYNIAPFSVWEAFRLIPANHTSSPTWYLASQLLNSFETGDQRKVAWLDTTNYLGTRYYYPVKYKVRIGTAVTEYYMVLRLTEQYLIRAEARAQENSSLAAAISDLNTIRARAGLPLLSTNLSQSQILAAVAQERKIEMFAEIGSRWLDLKRTGTASAALTPLKPQWTENSKLYPIPYSEIQSDANLSQNPGY